MHYTMSTPAYQFHSLAQQHATAKLGMWIFVTAEAALFGGFICAYFTLRLTRPEVVAYGNPRMDTWAGAVGTLLLICSSLTMALAVRLSSTRHSRYAAILLLMTFFLGLEFLGVKAYEATRQYQAKQTWGPSFYVKPQRLVGVVVPSQTASASSPAPSTPITALDPQIPMTALPIAASAPRGLSATSKTDMAATPASTLLHHSIDPKRPIGAHLFFALYNLTAWLLEIHLVLGLGVLLWLARRSAKREFGPKFSTPVELGGMYWHLLTAVSVLIFLLYYIA